MFAAIARFDIRFRWLIVAVWLLGLIGAVRLLPSLQSVNTFNSVQVLPASSHSQRADQLAEPFQGYIPGSAALNPMTAILVAHRASGPLTAADDAALGRVERDARLVPGVSLVRDEGTNPDGTAREALMTVTAPASKTEAVADNIVNQIRSSFVRARAPQGLRFHLTGPFAASVDATNVHPGNIAILTVIFLAVLLFVVYRSLLGPLLTLIPAVLSMLIAQRLIAEAVRAGLLSAAVIDLLVVLMLGVGADYGLFLTFRFREELARAGDPRQALVAAMTRIGEVLSYSALTVGLSLFILLAAPFELYRSIGPSFTIGIAVLLLAALTLIPALLAIFGRAAFWPSRPRPGQQERWLWGRVTAWVVRHPALTLAAGCVLFAALTAGLTGYRTGDFTSSAPAGSDSAAGTQVLATYFPKATLGSDQLLLRFAAPVWDHPAVLTVAQAQLAADPAFDAITGPLGPTHGAVTATQLARLHATLGPAAALPQVPPAGSPVPPGQYQLYRQTAQFISPDGRTVQYYAVLRAGRVGSTAAASAIPQANLALAAVARVVRAQASGVAGQDASAFDVSALSNTSNAVVVPAVLMLILILLSLLLRSLVAPWYLALTVGLSYLASLGFAMIVFVHLGGSDGLLFVLPLIMFIFTMAVGEDYNILVMSRIREEAAKRASFGDALAHAIGVTGGTVTSAGLILAGTFVVLGLAGGIGNDQQLGFAIAFGVIMDTFFVRTLLVPAIAMLLGRRNWWPSRLSVRRAADGPLGPAAGQPTRPDRSRPAGDRP